MAVFVVTCSSSRGTHFFGFGDPSEIRRFRSGAASAVSGSTSRGPAWAASEISYQRDEFVSTYLRAGRRIFSIFLSD